MKKTAKSEMDDDLRPVYDLRLLLKGGVKGKYAERYRAGTNLVLLDPDVAKAFANDEEKINGALRAALRLSRRPRYQKQRGIQAGTIWQATVKPSFRQRLHHQFLQQPWHSRRTQADMLSPHPLGRGRRKIRHTVQNRSTPV